MQKKALVIIDMQNDITKNYKEIIAGINTAIDWAVAHDVYVVYIKNHYLSAGRTFQPGTYGAELVADMKIVSDHIFVKTRASALTSEAFSAFINDNEINEFYIAGADAVGCIKSTCYNMAKKAISFMCYRIALPATISKRLTGCCNTMQTRDVSWKN